jgi:hypothetical protein
MWNHHLQKPADRNGKYWSLRKKYESWNAQQNDLTQPRVRKQAQQQVHYAS